METGELELQFLPAIYPLVVNPMHPLFHGACVCLMERQQGSNAIMTMWIHTRGGAVRLLKTLTGTQLHPNPSLFVYSIRVLSPTSYKALTHLEEALYLGFWFLLWLLPMLSPHRHMRLPTLTGSHFYVSPALTGGYS